MIVMQPQYPKRHNSGQSDTEDRNYFVVAQFVTHETYSGEYEQINA